MENAAFREEVSQFFDRDEPVPDAQPPFRSTRDDEVTDCRAPIPLAFGGDEIKKSLIDDGTAESPADQLAGRFGPCRAAAAETALVHRVFEWLVKKVACTDDVVGEEAVQASVDVLLPRPRHHVHHGSGVASEFSGEPRRHDLEILNAFDALRNQRNETLPADADVFVVVVRSVHREVVAPAPHAVDGKLTCRAHTDSDRRAVSGTERHSENTG